MFYCTVSNFPGATLLLNNLQPRSAAEWRPGLHIWDTVTLTGDTVSLGRVACLNCCFLVDPREGKIVFNPIVAASAVSINLMSMQYLL